MKAPKLPSCPKPLPRIARFEKLAYGLFLHFGLYSQLGRGEWIRRLGSIRPAAYEKLARTFTATDFDASALARLAKLAGMRYITLTCRHHDGFSLYDTRGLSDFDALHTPAGRDLVLEFVTACRAEGIVPFLYHTTLDWRWDTEQCSPARFRDYLEYLRASVEILCRHYGQIGGFWFDGNWSRKDLDWQEDRLYATIRRHQPDALIINNTGLDARGQTGHPEIDCTTFEQGLPIMPDRRGWKKYLAGEMCQTFNAHWGHGAHDFNFVSPREIIQNLCLSRKVGANYLLNMGPTAQGGIPEYESAALRAAGGWVARYGDILREGKPMAACCTGRDFLLQTDTKYYYFAFDLTIQGHANVTVGDTGQGPRAIACLPFRLKSARWLDSGEKLAVTQNPHTGDALLRCTGYPYGTHLVVRVAELS